MSTYSPSLRAELITNGTQAGTWGGTTNDNLSTVFDAAIAGVATVSVTSANQALTYVNGPTSTAAANESVRAVLSVSSTGSANLYAPPVSKLYIVKNTGSYPVTLYNSTVIGNTTAAGTGVTIYAGRTMIVWSDGTNFAPQADYFNGVTLASPNINNATLGTPASGTLTNCTGLPVSTGVSGLGTNVATFLATPSSANLAAALTDETGTGSAVFANSPTLVTPDLGTPSAINLTNATNIPTNQFTGGAVPVSAGGTGATTLTNAALLRGNGTSAVSAASAADIVAAIGTTAVANATTSANCTALVGLGFGSAIWRDVTGSRAQNTTYTNSRSYPISVSWWGDSSSGGNNFTLFTINGVVTGSNTGAANAGWRGGNNFIVPAGATYSISGNSGVTGWWELY